VKKFHVILAVLFFVPLFVLGIISVVDTDATVSLSEKRNLSTRPDFSFEDWFDGEFMSLFEEYYTDTFPFRENLIDYNQTLNLFYHFTPAEDESIVLISFDESVLLEGAENIENYDNTQEEQETEVPPEMTAEITDATSETQATPTPQPTKEIDYPEAGEEFKIGSGILIIENRAMSVVNKNENAIAGYAKVLSDAAADFEDIEFYSIIAPTSCEFYSPEFYHSDNRSQKNMLDECYGLMEGVNIANPYENLREKVDKYIYFRTDHHWTALGAYCAYEEFCDAAGIEAVDTKDMEQGKHEGFVGAFYNYTKSYPQSRNLVENPDTVYYYLPVVETETLRYNDAKMISYVRYPLIQTEMKYTNKYLCFIGGDFPLVKVQTNAGTGRVCVILKDSFGNVFSPFLANHYDTMYIIDPRKFNNGDYPAVFKLESFAEKYGVDDVIVVNNTYNINSVYYNSLLERIFQ